MLIIQRSKSGIRVLRFKLGIIETTDIRQEALRQRYGDSGSIAPYRIIGCNDGTPITLGEYADKQARDKAFERFIDAYVNHNCRTYESVDKGGETVFRPFRRRLEKKGKAADNGDSFIVEEIKPGKNI